ncbi:MAG TPA: BTAD domain-containing putative transcriptional regulator [Anaerolineales bacterium]|nr:BTAD domain-containing putative transcriptional regulator [Anaerolineales bacterium]
MGIQRKKDLALLIYLVVTAQPHSRDTLANLLWPDLSQSDARSNLRKSLSRLKAGLGEEYLSVSQDQAGIHPSIIVELDIAEFEKRVRQYRDHGHRRKGQAPLLCAGCQRSLEEAAQLYSADFLHGFTIPESSVFEEWLFFQSESLRQNLGEVLELLTYQHAYAGNYPAAIEYGRRWLSLDRLHEPAHRQLMILYALSGQQAAALRQFEECRELMHAELDVTPEPETLALFEAIKKKNVQGFLEPPAKASSPAAGNEDQPAKPVHNLPAHPAPFIGRERELEKIAQLLAEPSCRLLTLLGPGGNGKTRLATQAAFRMLQTEPFHYKDGVWFVNLAPLAEGQSIVSALSDGLQLSSHAKGSDIRQKLLGHLHGRQMLLVLDNFEHLLNEDNVSLIVDLLSMAPLSRILTTSRERLNIEGETVFRVEGLEIPTGEAPQPLPEPEPIIPAYSALRLFEQCAKRVQPMFQITKDNYADIAQICQHVQGMPLAIELAASWLEVLSPAEINREIARSLDFLESSRRDLPDRQRSIRAVFDSSWTLLDRQTRPIVKALSIFRTSFTREAAQAVSGASAKALLELTNQSWLHRLSDGRYQIHELLRKFAYEILSREMASLLQVKKQFCEYYASYTNSLWDRVKGPDQQQAYAGVQAEFDNIQTAWLWLVSENRIETAVQSMLPMLLHFCESRGKVADLKHMITTALAALHTQDWTPTRDRLEIKLRTAEGAFHFDGFPLRLATYEGIFPIDMETSNRAWSLSEQMDIQELGFWGILLAFIHGRLIDVEEGVRKLKQMVPQFKDSDHTWELANTYLHIAKLLNYGGEVSSSEQDIVVEYLSQAQDIFTSLGDHINRGYTLSQWGELKLKNHDLEGAVEQWTAARTSLQAHGEWATANDISWQLTDVYIQLGEFQKAFECCKDMFQVYLAHGLRENAVTILSKESFEKVRYGDIEDALRLRQQCIEMLHDTGPEYQFGWNYWEMGEVLRVLGRLEEASDWYERSRQVFEKFNDYAGTSFYYRGVGDVSLAKREYEAARSAFTKSLQLAQQARHTWSMTYVTAGLGKSEIGLGDVESASLHLRQAAGLTRKAKDRGIALVLILAVANLYTCEAKLEKAVELGALVESHFSSWFESRTQATALLKTLSKEMDPEKFQRARNRGTGLDVWETVEQLA